MAGCRLLSVIGAHFCPICELISPINDGNIDDDGVKSFIETSNFLRSRPRSRAIPTRL